MLSFAPLTDRNMYRVLFHLIGTCCFIQCCDRDNFFEYEDKKKQEVNV